MLRFLAQKNAEMVTDGPDGLPALNVYEAPPRTVQTVGRIALAPPKKRLRFTIAIATWFERESWKTKLTAAA